MAGTVDDQRAGDPFGNRVQERLTRRLAGAGLLVVLAAALGMLWRTELLPWVMTGAFVVYLLGVPASWLATRNGGAPVLRHVAAGVAVGILAAGGLTLLFGAGLTGWAVIAPFSVGIGIPVAAFAAWFGLALPSRAVWPAAVAGLLVATVVLPVGVWWERRPPAPYDFVVVHEPADVRPHFATAYELAEAIAAAFGQRIGAGRPGTAHATWVAVAQELSERELDSVPSRMHYTLDDELPTLRSSGEPVRLVTTVFDDDPRRACVIVTATVASAEPRPCGELDLVR